MRTGNAAGGFILTGGAFSMGLREMATLLCSRRARRALRGLILLRRVYEHVLVLATLEGVRAVRRPYYEGYVDALIARTL
jgi:hypothetical protein